MNKVALLLILALVATTVLAVHEIPMKHRKRTPSESKMLLEYMSRGGLAERVNKILAKIFPSKLTANIYAYPEVKILNYLDAQYYG
jgi:predicted thioredoxin/glutaredoxin